MNGGIEAQSRRTLENLNVKVTILVTEMRRFAAVNEVYRESFASEPPPRTPVGIIGPANPRMTRYRWHRTEFRDPAVRPTPASPALHTPPGNLVVGLIDVQEPACFVIL